MYEEIADYTAQAMDKGTIPYGGRLPSLRDMSRLFRCSVSVVMQAYEELEIRGRVRPVERSGYFALPPSPGSAGRLPAPEAGRYTLKSEPTRPLSIIGRIVEAGNNPQIVPLGAGNPHESLLPVAALQRCVARAGKEQPRLFREYSDQAGSPSLRDRIAAVMRNRGVDAEREDILITNGCTEALVLAVLSCTGPGDAVATESPVFLGIIQILEGLGRRIVPVPTSPLTGMDLDALEQVMARGEAKACILSAAFQNPLGFVMPENHRIRAARLAGEYGIPLIEDDIYGECSFLQEYHRPIRSFDDSGMVIYCSSFSKTVSPGMRAGWMLAGKWTAEAGNMKITLNLGGSPLLQESMAEFLKSTGYEAHIRRLRKSIARQAADIRRLMLEHFPEGTAISAPRGGYYFWVEFPGNPDCLELFEKGLKKGVGIVPGPAFGSGGRFGNCIRVSFGSPVDERTTAGIARLGELVRELQKH
jgi:DNA-binding transcriptional MocR family regulator